MAYTPPNYSKPLPIRPPATGGPKLAPSTPSASTTQAPPPPGESTPHVEGGGAFGDALNDYYAGQPERDRRMGIANDAENTYGATLGSASTMGPAYDQSEMRWDQSNRERTADQIGNFQYGGYEGGAGDAVQTARDNMGGYTDTLTGYGDTFMEQSQGAAGREAPIDEYNLGQHDRGTQGVYGSADTLTDLAMQGPGASQAQAQLDASTAQSMRQQLAMAGSGRGAGGGAAAFRNAAAQQAQIQGGANAQAAVIRAQAWRKTQAGMLTSAGGLYDSGADTALSGAQYTTGAEQAQTQMNDQYALGMGDLAVGSTSAAGNLQLGTEGLANDINTTALQGNMGYESNMTDIYAISQSGARAPSEPGVAGVIGGVAGAAIGTYYGGAAGGAAGYQAGSYLGGEIDSDEDLKKNISKGDALRALDELIPYSYDYKDTDRPGSAEGRQIGVMAQDLEKSSAGKSTVSKDSKGYRQVDAGRLEMLNTAGLAAMYDRVDELEKELSTLKGGKGKMSSDIRNKKDIEEESSFKIGESIGQLAKAKSKVDEDKDEDEDKQTALPAMPSTPAFFGGSSAAPQSQAAGAQLMNQWNANNAQSQAAGAQLMQQWTSPWKQNPDGSWSNNPQYQGG